HGAGRGRVRHRLQHSDESSGATTRARHVERFTFQASRPAGPRGPQQLTGKNEVRSQLSAVSREVEDDGSVARGNEPLDVPNEFVDQLALRPASGRDDVPGAAKMPRPLDQA